MTQKQLNQYEVISKANVGFITVKEAAEALGLSSRQIQRLKKRVKEEGTTGILHKNTRRTPHNKRTPEEVEQILELKRKAPYATANFSHYRELLAEHHQIEISYSSLYSMLKTAEIHSPKTRRRFKPHRWRKRRSQAGMLLQIDATSFAWFTGDKKRYSLHGAIEAVRMRFSIRTAF